ncbi:hypothetical protein PLESTB_000197200 [Pleodorina starrii]|uniref:asparaginase n=1 Tax=Pleodorina starrii TaxID=330485 RepID=A0A9W6BBY5_9CHLO|nr:hypothetical protein PLESTM_000334600 [Pleodorina starrii]GLC49234.1 hypothetical protein PLESTB_000197200 [Pleodorina starrii]GLC73514.1 hypothetical protein PLESTF_001385900 [Pleodorina starrii]
MLNLYHFPFRGLAKSVTSNKAERCLTLRRPLQHGDLITTRTESPSRSIICCSSSEPGAVVAANVTLVSEGGLRPIPFPAGNGSALEGSDRRADADIPLPSDALAPDNSSGNNRRGSPSFTPGAATADERAGTGAAASSSTPASIKHSSARKPGRKPSSRRSGGTAPVSPSPAALPPHSSASAASSLPVRQPSSRPAALTATPTAPRSSPSPDPAPSALSQAPSHRPHPRLRTVTKPLPRVLFLHTGGTLGMDPEEAFEEDEGHNLRVRAGATEGAYKGTLRPGEMLSSLLTMVPELEKFANVDLQVLFNKDSSRVGPSDWITIARALDSNRQHYDAFVVVHGTDTLAYTASALSLMLCGFKKPIVLTGSQLPLRAPRTDARQNLLDSIQVATSAFSPPHVALQEVAVCFGGKLMRGNRTQKVNSAAYQAFDSLTYPYLATLGIDVDWNTRVLLRVEGAYNPRFKLDPRVIRIPVVPGSDPRIAYGDLYGRGVRGVVLEAFGVGNLPDQASYGWLPWLKDQTARGLQVCLTSQCLAGPLHPALYRAGQLAARMGVNAGPHMTPECAAVKLMFCLKHPDLALGVPLAGEL